MVAATYFFTVERDRAVGKWKTSLTVAALVCGIAAITTSTCVGFGSARARARWYSIRRLAINSSAADY